MVAKKKIAMMLECPQNQGDIAVVLSIVRTLNTVIPGSHTLVFSASTEGLEPYRERGVDAVESPWQTKANSKLLSVMYSGIKVLNIVCSHAAHGILKPFGISVHKALPEYDLFLENGTDIHTYGGLGFYYSFYPVLLNILLRRPFVIYAESLGPFKGPFQKILMRFILRRAKMISVRENISLGHLQDLGIIQPVYVTTDPAFLLKPCSPKQVDKILIEEGLSSISQPLVGITASELVSRYAFPAIKDAMQKKREFIAAMAAIADY